jgi:hypothetical protein
MAKGRDDAGSTSPHHIVWSTDPPELKQAFQELAMDLMSKPTTQG